MRCRSAAATASWSAACSPASASSPGSTAVERERVGHRISATVSMKIEQMVSEAALAGDLWRVLKRALLGYASLVLTH
jgi:hypothetical protein